MSQFNAMRNIASIYAPPTANVNFNRPRSSFTEREEQYIEPPKNRSMLDRITSPLSVGQYAVAGFTKGLQREDLNPIQGLLQGIYAANPFGQGKDEWRHSFTDVLRETDWQPEGKAGRFVQSAVGLGLDIFLDPMTYVSLPLGTAVKGSGKHAAEIAVAGNKIPINVSDVSKGIGISVDQAKDMIKATEIFKDGRFVGDLSKEAVEFARKYNKLIGVNQKARGVTLSLGNAPFGKKIFGDASSISKTIFTPEQVMEFGDKGLAPLYGKARNSIMGGKIGKKFSTSHEIFKLSKNKPEEVFKFFKRADLEKGINSSTAKAIKEAISKSEDLRNLSPNQNKEILELMENPSEWNKIQKMINFSDTKEGAHQLQLIFDAKKKEVNRLEQLSKVFDDIGDGKEIKEALNMNQDELDKAYKLFSEELLGIRKEHLSEVGRLDEYNKALDVATEIQSKTPITDKQVIKNFDEFMEGLSARRGQTEVNKTLTAELDRKLTVTEDKVLPIKRLEMSNQTFDEKFFKPKDITDTRYNNIKRAFSKDGHKVYKTERGADKLIEDFKELGFQKYKNELGEYVVTMKGVTGNTEALSTVSSASDEIYESMMRIDKKKMVDDISEYVFGQKDMISMDTWDKSDRGLSAVVDMIKDGRSKEEIGNFIYRNKDFYTGKSSEVYRFAAREVGGYGGTSDFPTWTDYYTKRIKELAPKQAEYEKTLKYYEKAVERGVKGEELVKYKEAITPALTRRESLTLTELKEANLQRELILNSFKDIDGVSDTRKMIAEIENGRLREEYDRILQFDVDSIAENSRERWIKYNNGKNWSLSEAERFDVETDFHRRIANAKDEVSTTRGRKVDKNVFESSVDGVGEAYSDFMGEKVKVNGRYSPIGELEIGYFNGKLTKLKDMDVRQVRNTINRFGDKGFKDRFGVSNVDFKRLKDFVDVQSKDQLLASIRASKIDGSLDPFGGVDKITRDVVANYTDEYNDLLNKMQTTHTDLYNFGSDKHEALMDKAINNVNARITAKEKAHFTKLPMTDTTKKTKDVVREGIERAKRIKGLDDINSPAELSTFFDLESKDVSAEMDKMVSSILDGSYEGFTSEKEIRDMTIDRITNAQSKYKSNYKKINDIQMDLTRKMEKYTSTYKETTRDIERTAKKVREMEELINSNKAFEVYMRSSDGVGSDVVNEALERANKHVGEYILNPKGDFDETVRKVATEMKNELYQMGVKEVDIGKLTKEQFEGLMDAYMPHIITDEAKMMIDTSRDVGKGIEGFGADFGFGREFNPYAISRSITELTIDGKVVKNPTIKQINKYFEPMLKGNKMFNESVADLYLARATKHTHLMYDHEYMSSMAELLGEKLDVNTISDMREGFDSVMNYGKMREVATDYAGKMSRLDKSDITSNYLRDPDVQTRIKTLTNARHGTPAYKGMSIEEVSDSVFQEIIQEFTDSYFTKEVSDGIYKKNLNTFLDSTGTKEALNEVQLPFSRIDGRQLKDMNEMTEVLKDRYEKNLFKSFKNITGSDAKHLSVDEMSDYIQEMIDGGIVKSNEGRFQNVINKIEDFKNIKEAEVMSLQSSIVNKTNQARELQIVRDNSDFLNLYDKVTHFMKLNQTTVLPGFHTKNKAGNTFRSWLGAGEDILNLDMQKGSFKAIKSKGEFAGEAFTSINGTIHTWDDLFQSANALGVMDSNAFAKEIGASASGRGLFRKFIPGKFDPTDTQRFGWYKAGTTVGTFTENQDRLLHFAAHVKQGRSLEHAAELSQKFLFDYGDLTFFEQNVMKRILPYYTWIRKNTPLQMEMLLDQPDKFRNVTKFLGGIESMVDDEDRIDKRWVNDFARDWIQLPFSVKNPEGRSEPVMLNPNLPMSSFNDIPNPFAMGESIRNYANKLNPIMKIPFELATNRHIYFDSDIVGKNATRSEAISTRIDHVASQFSAYPVAKGFAQKTGADLGLHTINSMSGVKALSYDYDKFKAMKMQELGNKRAKSNYNPGILDSIKRRLSGY